VVVAIPSTGVVEQLTNWGARIAPDATLVSLVKGVDVGSRRFGSQLIAGTADVDPDRVVVISGPNLAAECARRQPAATVSASPDLSRAEQVQAMVMSGYFRVYTNRDKVGVEVAGAAKNVMALAAGMAHGMGFGDNTKAMVVTRGLAEMTRLGVALGGQPLTFSGLAGVGDLVATCTSPRSRNRTVGERLGQGEKLDDIIASMNMVAEGVKSSQAILAIAAEVGVDMPLARGVVGVCHEGLDPAEMVGQLMTRSAKRSCTGSSPEPRRGVAVTMHGARVGRGADREVRPGGGARRRLRRRQDAHPARCRRPGRGCGRDRCSTSGSIARSTRSALGPCRAGGT
jgi:glycerol-3-phosphate dehydrogenase (NAD(P)+)